MNDAMTVTSMDEEYSTLLRLTISLEARMMSGMGFKRVALLHCIAAGPGLLADKDVMGCLSMATEASRLVA